MNSTNNEIYKIAKYLDKYTKESNKEGNVYLQKLDNYLHKVQRGGGEVLDLAKQIGLMVEEVVRVHQKAKSELQKSLRDVKGDSLEKQYNEKVMALKEQISGLEKTIAQKQSSPSPKAAAAAAASAPEVITLETLTSENITSIRESDLAQIIATLADDHVREKINDESILNLVRDVSTYEISQIITDIKQNFGSLTASTILKKLYTDGAFEKLPKDYKTTILFIEITIAILKIKKKILGETHNEISELTNIVSDILRLPNDDCKESVSKLFIEYVNSNESSELIISSLSFIEYYENDWRYRISCTTKDNFSQEITAKEVCRRLDIDEKIKEDIITFPTQIPTWNMYKIWTIVFVIYMLYNKPKPYGVVNEVFKDDKNAIIALKVAQQLMYMKFEAMEIREGKKVGDVKMQTVRGVSDIIDYLEGNNSDIAIFKEYVKDAYFKKNVDYMSLEDFIAFKSKQSSAVPAPASSALASSASSAAGPAPASSASSVPVSAPASSASPAASTEQLRKEAEKLVSKQPTKYDSLESDKFFVMGYIVNPKTGRVFAKPTEGVYKFPGESETVGKSSKQTMILLKSSLRQPIIDALQITDKIKLNSNFNLSDNTTLKISLNSLVNIREFVDRINNAVKIVQLTSSEETNNVRLFVKPMTYKQRDDITENEIKINEFAEIISKAILSLVANTQPTQVPQSPGGSATGASAGQPYRTNTLGIGSAAQSPRDRGGRGGRGAAGGSMSSRGPYRHPSSLHPHPSTPITNE